MYEKFSSLEEAQGFIAAAVDRPLTPAIEQMGQSMVLHKTVLDLGSNRFTNIYDLVFDEKNEHPEIIAFDALGSVYDFARNNRDYKAVTSGGFFYLADSTSSIPRQLALNLSLSRGQLRSLPVVDREAVIAGRNGLEVRSLVALGSLSLNGHELGWSGACTDYDTEVKVYSNGNAIIRHQADPITGTIRVLEESSRYTPVIPHDDYMDVGFIHRTGNEFVGVGGSPRGEVDIFAHDFVVRCHRRYIEGISELKVRTIGGLALEKFRGGAFSAGPALNIASFNNHSINRDLSLGDRAPFADTPLARSVLYKSEDGLIHVRLFDGRPGSLLFPGVTPGEAVEYILSEGEVEWGCFLDPGQTTKLCVNYGERTESHGNRHYIRWPSEGSPDFVWVPDTGRPIANVIAV